jgi:DNA-binding GntR family transcriptional regulator
MALRRAFPQLTFTVLGQAEDLLHRIEHDQKLSAADRGAMNWQFHLMLYQASQCPHLLRLLHSLHQQVERYLGFQEISMNYAEISHQEHWQLLKLLRLQQLDAAVDLLQRHIQQAGELLTTHLRSHHSATPTQQASNSQ